MGSRRERAGHAVGTRRFWDARDLFERTVNAMCQEHGLDRRLSPGDIEDWDEIHALAQRERVMAAVGDRR